MAQLLNAFTSELTGDELASLLEDIKPRIFKLASQNNLEADELLQDLAVQALSCIDKIAVAMNRQAFLCGMAQMLIKQAYRQANHRSPLNAMSLDAPLSDNDNVFSLADTLVYPDDVDTSKADLRAQIVHAALRRLPLEEQIYMREVHGLNSFNPLPSDWSRKPNYDRSRRALGLASYRRLRNDPALASALEVHA